MARRTRKPRATPGVFCVCGVPLDSLYPRRRSIRWAHGEVSGDPELVAAAHDRAHATRQPMSDPATAAALLAAFFIPGTVETSGDLPA